ncbi:MAG: DUF4079 domain-containing protein [Synechococcus sp.]|uniref:DUF4079 domain-containing protein n=1 Tax=unclassified Synechococcus TaxID=2626047 RepID=UPI0001525668|nr:MULTISPECIES: DUF4079 domain-containing protein [unclassified Synechococcus]MCT0251581.1 DUF4079 domain-containing protein [Synechococcus sp. CS-197]QNI66817.1 putative conserved membrane protein [Synechococcus sp. BMK-MC-1]CAK23024.1 Uncharacterized conserved membrane protein [Synechococcus sp. WH 7803]
MTTVDWLGILHPALAVVIIYPLIGMVVRLAIQTRARRLQTLKCPPTVGREHSDLGRWLAVGVVVLVLVALTVAIATDQPLRAFQGGAARAAQLLLVLCGSLAGLAALWVSKAPGLRLAFVLITWAGVLGLGAQPEVWRLSDDPFSPAFWQSHYWSGVAVVGLMLFSLGAQPEIQRDLRLRRLHVSANVLAAVLFVVQGITGSRDLLEIPLSWQKSTIYSCNFTARTCPPLAAPTSAPAVTP